MLGGGGEDLINLADCVDDFFTNKPSDDIKDEKTLENIEKAQVIETILNEEIDTQNLPASPPFTKVSSIKMFSKTEIISKKPSTPLRPKHEKYSESNDTKENRTATLARKDCTKSFLPRIKKRQKQ